MPKETENFLAKPEFEKNCDAFVNEVNSLIKGSYKNIQIDAENDTMHMFTTDSEYTNEFRKIIEHTKNPEKYKESFERLLRSKDAESAEFNFASVDIWIWKNHTSSIVLQETVFALNDIIKCSQKHSGELLSDLPELISDTDNESDDLEMSLGDLEILGSFFRGNQEGEPGINHYEKGRFLNAHLYFSFTNPKKLQDDIIDNLLFQLAKKQK